MTNLIAIHEETGQIIREGERVKDFRGDVWVLVKCTRANDDHRSGKVLVNDPSMPANNREFYSRVFDLMVVDLDSPWSTPMYLWEKAIDHEWSLQRVVDDEVNRINYGGGGDSMTLEQRLWLQGVLDAFKVSEGATVKDTAAVLRMIADRLEKNELTLAE